MLSLETPQNPMQFQHAQMVSYAGNNGGDDQHHHHQMQPPVKPSPYLYASKPKQSSSLSDEDEHGSGYNPEDGAGANGKRKFSQWQRVKWTDAMVKLLIMAVFYMGDEAGSSEPAADPAKKRLSSSSPAGGGMVQKKGKWKSVSRAMMEKGFYVSPQQCEDKFNDLNKRYKRVNDMLGKGTACRVVENQGLLDAMDIPLKLKEEVKKLLHSKHLFFREMCAYHNSCGHLNADPPQTQTQSCFHPAAVAAVEEESEPETAEDSESGDDSSEEVGKKRRKRASETMAVTVLMEEAGKVAMEEKKEWMKMKMVEMEERRVAYEWERVEMEKQRLKWIRFKGKKEREMEKTTLQIQRRRLENERMLLLLRRMGMELELQSGRIG